MKKIIYTLFILSAISANAQQWQQYNVTHTKETYCYGVEMASYNVVSASLWEDISAGSPYTNRYYRTIDGTNWEQKTLSATSGYVISGLYPIDADTCYAMMYNENAGSGGGLFKTKDGGTSWSQIGAGTMFTGVSFPDWVYFWNAKEGVALGDANGPGTPYLEIYTTSDYGVTWTRVPRENIPSFADAPYGITNSYTVFGDRIWFQGTDAAAGGFEYIYRSDDKGLHWEAFPIATPSATFSDFTFTDEQHGMVIGYDDAGTPYLFRSEDGGETWATISYTGPLMGSFIARVPGAPSTLVSCSPAAIGGGSSYSYDMGTTWASIDESIGDGENQHSDVKFLSTSSGWSGQYRQFGSTPQPGGMYKWVGTVLPVTLTTFTAAKKSESILLNWQTANESNNAYFAVERSADGVNFKEIGRINGRGYTTQPQQYNFEDFAYLHGQNYYRLRQVNNDGKYTYSLIVSVEMVGSQIVKLYPNPVQNMLHVDGLNAAGTTKLSIVNNAGKVLQQASIIASSYNMNLQQLPAGVYYLRIESDKKTSTMKFVKQ